MHAAKRSRGSEPGQCRHASLDGNFEIEHLFERSMEQFALSASHSGAINHIHSFHFNSSVVDVAKEARYIAAILVGGWVLVTSLRVLRRGIGKGD